jgi:hypothetical protein
MVFVLSYQTIELTTIESVELDFHCCPPLLEITPTSVHKRCDLNLI